MSQITINFSNVTLSSTNTTIALTGGGFELDVDDGLSIFGTVSFSSMYLTSGAISFNVPSGTTFNAALQVTVVSVAPNVYPEIEVTNFQGTVTATWPTSTGLQTQMLESSNPLTLTGYVS